MIMAREILRVKKRLGPFSCVHRNHKANSHCRFLHGYGRYVTLTLAASKNSLTNEGWVYDFGGFKDLCAILENAWDHKTVISEGDPSLSAFRMLHDGGLIDLVVMGEEYDGLEGQARFVYKRMTDLLNKDERNRLYRASSVRVESVEVFEHENNSAIYTPAEVGNDE